MNDKPSDNPADSKPADNQDHAQEQVQDYLDMLLSRPSVRSEPPISHRSERATQPRVSASEHVPVDKLAPSLSMVGGTVVSAKSLIKPLPDRPFAESVKHIAFKMPGLKPQPPVVEGRMSPPVPLIDTKVPPLQVLANKRLAEPASIKVAESPLETEHVDVIQAAAQTPLTTRWLENGRPSWAQQRFECLLFSVGGLTLAVPLVELGSIYPVTAELTPIFGQVDWFMGLLPIKDRNIRMVNTARVVMPERYVDSMKEQFAYVISINAVDWGLAVDSVSNAITLEPDDVRWRGERGKRPWLAGTVVEHMCALLDVSQLTAMFYEQDRA